MGVFGGGGGTEVEDPRQAAALYQALNVEDDEEALAIFNQNFLTQDYLGDRIGQFMLGEQLWGTPKKDRAEDLRRQRQFVLQRETMKARKRGDTRAERRLQLELDRFQRQADWREEDKLDAQERESWSRAMQLDAMQRGDFAEAQRIRERAEERDLEAERYAAATATREEAERRRREEADREYGLRQRRVKVAEEQAGRIGKLEDQAEFQRAERLFRNDLTQMDRQIKQANDMGRFDEAQGLMQQRSQMVQQFNARWSDMTGGAAGGVVDTARQTAMGGPAGIGGMDAPQPGSAAFAIQGLTTPQAGRAFGAQLTQVQNMTEANYVMSRSPMSLQVDPDSPSAAAVQRAKDTFAAEAVSAINRNPNLAPEQKTQLISQMRAYRDNPTVAQMNLVKSGEFYRSPVPPAEAGTLVGDEWELSRTVPTMPAGILAALDIRTRIPAEEFSADSMDQAPTHTLSMSNSIDPNSDMQSGQLMNQVARSITLLMQMSPEMATEIERRADTPEELVQFVNMAYREVSGREGMARGYRARTGRPVLIAEPDAFGSPGTQMVPQRFPYPARETPPMAVEQRMDRTSFMREFRVHQTSNSANFRLMQKIIPAIMEVNGASHPFTQMVVIPSGGLKAEQ